MSSARSRLPFLTFLAPAALAFAAAPPTSSQDNAAAVYNDSVSFGKISNAAQNALVARFGPVPVYDSKGNLIPPRTLGSRGMLKNGFKLPGTLVPPTSQNALGNVLVNDAAGDATAQDTQSETTLSLGSGGKLISSFNDSGSYLGTNSFTGWAYSLDGGSTWSDPGILPGGNDAGDPSMAHNTTTNRAYLATLRFDFAGINIFRSDNDGVSWQAAVNGAPGASGFMDKEWLTVDNFAGAGNGNVYLVSRSFGGIDGISFWRSLDNGDTWGPNGGTQIVAGGVNVQGAYVLVGPAHEVYAVWYDANPVPAEIRICKSMDQGLTFGATTTVTQLVSDQVNGNLLLPAGFRSSSFPQVVVNPVSGHLYCSYNDPTATSGGDRGNIKLRVSINGGSTWLAPIQVNDDATSLAQYFPSLAVRPDGTGLAVCWYDNRGDPSNINIERWGATATISGSTLTFGTNFRISPRFPPVFGVDPVINTVYMGDYDQMQADNTNYYTTWGDNRDNSIAVPGRKNANVRFASFGQEGPGAIIDLGTITVEGGNFNGRIEPNECNDLFVSLTNSGAQPATAISGVLSSATPGVTIFDAAQAYPDLAGGDAGVNASPYRVSTSPAFACGTTIQFVLTVSSSAGAGPISFSIPTGGSDYVVAVDAGNLTGGGTDIGNHGDDQTTAVTLPFPVTYYAGVFNALTVSSNGNIQFSSNSTAFTNPCLPDAFTSDTIAVHWDDMRTDAAGSGVFRQTTGVTPSRTFILQWRCTYFGIGGNATFELRLHENSSSFEMVYGQLDGTASSATIGCQRGTGPTATSFACSVGGSVGLGTKLSFSLPGCPAGGGECNAVVTGSCCLVDGSCVEVTAADCIAIGGLYSGDGTLCVDAHCPQPTGACCLSNGSCVEVTEEDCGAQHGIFNGDFSTCSATHCVRCVTLDFGTEDDFLTPIGDGQTLTTPPEFGVMVSVAGTGSNLGLTAFDSTPGGPNSGTIDPDMLIGKGNILMLQDNAQPTQTVSGFFDTPIDDPNGGNIVFNFTLPSSPRGVALIDIDPEPNQGCSVILTDGNGKTRTYAVQPGWTGSFHSVPGWKRLDLTTLSNQVGNAPGFRQATVSQMTDYDQDNVVRMVVHLTGYGAIDDLEFCQ